MKRLLITAVLALATSAQAQRREIDPAQYASFVKPVAVKTGELIVSGLTPTDHVAGPNWTADVFVITARAGEAVTAQLRSDIPSVQVHIHHTKSHTGKAIVEGPAQAAPLRFVAPKDGDYFVAVHAKGPERFGAYMLALGSDAGAPSFDQGPSLVRTAQEVASSAGPADTPAFTEPPACKAQNSDFEACRDALSAIVQVTPDKHLARLRLADADYHLKDYAALPGHINAVRARLSSDQFEALLAAQNDWVMTGDPSCRMIVHKSPKDFQWRGPCAGGEAEGKGALIGLEDRTASISDATFKGGVLVGDGLVWHVQQTSTGFDYYRAGPEVRMRTIRPEQAPPSVQALFAELQPTLGSRLLKGHIASEIEATDAKLAGVNWPRRCYSYRAVTTEKHRLTLRTGRGRVAWVGIQPGNNCDAATWQPYSGGVGGAEKMSSTDTVSLDVVLSPGTYVIGVSGGPNPGPFTYDREQLPLGGGIVLGKGAPEALAEAPAGEASTATWKAERAYRPGEVIRDCSTCPEIVVIPAGSFMLGSPATEEGRQGVEGPRKRVTFKRAFGIGKYEVTYDEWNACVAAGACAAKADNDWGQGRRPVTNVDYNDARAYLRWLSKTTGAFYYLPSESEWEYAARAGTDTPWNTGDGIITDDANILNAFGRTVPVGGFPANAFGLHDMHGNVAEYVQDCFEVGYFETPTDGRAKRSNGKCVGVMRGGNYSSEPVAVRSAARAQAAPPGPTQGLRVTRLLD